MAALRTVRTMCPMNCHPTLCGMLVDVEDGRIAGVRGDPDNPDSRGFLSVRVHAAREVAGPAAVGTWSGHGFFANDYGTRVSSELLRRFANLYGCQWWSPTMICW